MASDIDICNVALSLLGADSIRSFTEDNKRARLSKNLFDHSRSMLLGRFDWSFARKLVKLQALDPDDLGDTAFTYTYQIPSDCVVPLSLWPGGNRVEWHVSTNTIITNLSAAYLVYTCNITDPARFNAPFINSLSQLLAAKLAPSIVQDRNLRSEFLQVAESVFRESSSEDANVGSEYRFPDEDPNLDTFVLGEEPVIVLPNDAIS